MSEHLISLGQAETEAQIIQFHSPDTMHRTAYQSMSDQIDDAWHIIDEMDPSDIIDFHIDTLEESNQPFVRNLFQDPDLLEVDIELAEQHLNQLILAQIMGEQDEVTQLLYGMSVYDDETQGIIKANLAERVIPNQAREKNIKPKLEELGEPFFEAYGDEFKEQLLSREALERARTRRALIDLLMAPEQPRHRMIAEMEELTDVLDNLSFAIAVMPFVESDKAFELVKAGISRTDQYADFYEPYINAIEAMFAVRPNLATHLGQLALDHDMVEVGHNTASALGTVIANDNVGDHTAVTISRMLSDFEKGV